MEIDPKMSAALGDFKTQLEKISGTEIQASADQLAFFSFPVGSAFYDVNADLKLTHFCSGCRFKTDTPPLRSHTAYALGAVSRLLFAIPAAR